MIALIARIKPTWRNFWQGIAKFSGLAAATYLLFALSNSQYAEVLGVIIAGLGTLAVLTAIPLLVLFTGATFLRAAGRVGNAVDALGLLARARSDQAFNFLITRFGSQRITQDPDVRQALEKLVGEMEQAQVRADSEKELLIWKSCPSLAAYPRSHCRVLDRFTLTSLRVQEIREETLDEMARLVEQE
ncbi:hypothetical protein ABZX92_45030 [Lentzea sp. NPDC006480]|uniref:hypothetical protein n=1 Tax=Lentzea sp. NPDC006480 TaxID=3157176 RepID=UPI0033A6778C